MKSKEAYRHKKRTAQNKVEEEKNYEHLAV